MLRRTMLLAAAASIAAACSRQAAQPAPSGPDPAEAIISIYAPYMAPNAPFPDFEHQAPWSQDLWAQMQAMMARSREIDEPILNFDPVINAQDGGVSALAVTTDAVAYGSHAVVRARFVNLGRQEEILFDLIWENDAWRVNNIRHAEWDLREIITPPA